MIERNKRSLSGPVRVCAPSAATNARKSAVWVLSFLLALFLSLDAGRAAATNQIFGGKEIEITASQAEFDPETQIFTGSDGVEIRSEELVIRGREMFLDQEGLLKVTGEVKLVHPDFFMQGEELLYNFQTETGEVKEVTGNMEGTLFRGSRAEIIGSSLFLKDAIVTRCNLPVPDLAFSAGRIRVENERIKTGVGWLKVKGLSLLPLPPLSLPTKRRENWPVIHVGYDEDWAFFFSASLRRPFLTRSAISTGVRAGANGRVELSAGLHWFPTESLTLDTNYAWNNRAGEQLVFSLTHQEIRSRFRVGITNNREAGKIPGEGWIRFSFPVASRLTGELFMRKAYPHKITDLGASLGDPKAESFGGRVRKSWSSRFSTRHGLIYAQWKWGKEYLDGWQLETAATARLLRAGPLSLRLEASYLWGKEGGLWNTQKLVLIQDLHCFEAVLSYDFLEKKPALEIDLVW